MAKICDLDIKGDKCYFKLLGCSNNELLEIVGFKSWMFKSWKYGNERKYFAYIWYNGDNEKIIWSYLGFAPILVRYLQGLGYIVNGKELFRSKEIIIGNMYYGLWDFQLEAVKAWYNNGCYGVIKSPTGSGKSIIGCDIMKKMGVRTLISVHTSDLMINVWFNNLVEQFSEGIKNRIGLVGGGLSKNDRKDMRLSGDCSFEYNIKKDIVIATSQSVLNRLDDLTKERFGLLVVDEVHHYSAEQFRKVASSVRAPYRLGLSATLYRSDGTSPLFYGLMGDLCYAVGIRELVGKGILVEPVFETIIIDDSLIQSQIATCGLKQLELSRYIKKMSSSSVVKKDYIINLVKALHMNKKRFLMYTDFVTPADNVFTRDDYVRELLGEGINVIGVSSELSSNEREKLFNELKIGKLDGLVFGALGSEGVNIPAVDSVIMCNATASTIRFPQRVGRAMRSVRGDPNKKYAFIYEMCLNIDKELEWSENNFHEYKTEGYTKEKKFIKM